ncbi:hypothetical protein BDQ12DRAFT_681406 [Crucibulum laeve]|uniref:Uncharacterized protein n=1 Tax=Crucibulum laeve TaxID=68775 RepID=A0A5C3M3A2_9AGAR|nr:hypothetical protein BDQ12DRAFT_681406 [Crucibulum laeve]
MRLLRDFSRRRVCLMLVNPIFPTIVDVLGRLGFLDTSSRPCISIRRRLEGTKISSAANAESRVVSAFMSQYNQVWRFYNCLQF